jgi:uncharacterized phage infection (PIP) family protein YhgE
MGNCAAAYERWQEIRAEKKRAAIDNVLGRMNESMNDQILRFKQKEEEYEGKIRGVQMQIVSIKRVAAKNKPTVEQRGLLVKLIGRRKLFEKERDRYAQMQLQTETAKSKIEGMRTNASLLKQYDQLQAGMKDLTKLGLNVKGVESKLDSAEDVMEDISEFNIAFTQQRESAEPALSEEDMQDINAEIDEEFATGKTLHTIPISAPKFKTRSPVEDLKEPPAMMTEDDEERLAAEVMQEL